MSQVSFSSSASSGKAPTFREARDLLLNFRGDYHGARAAFVWPRPERFNWALDWFDPGTRGRRGRPQAGAESHRRRRRNEELRRPQPGIVAARQWSARARGEARRPAPDDAGRGAGAMGDNAGRDETWAGADPGDAGARPSGYRRSAGPRQGEVPDHPRRRGGEIRARRRNDRADRDWRGATRLAILRRASRRRRALRARQSDQGRRPDAPLFHLGYDRALEAGCAQPCELPDWAFVDDVRTGSHAR